MGFSMKKIKLIFELPSNAPFGSREKTCFFKIPDRVYKILKEMAQERDQSLDEFMHIILKDELNRLALLDDSIPNEENINLSTMLGEVGGIN